MAKINKPGSTPAAETGAGCPEELLPLLDQIRIMLDDRRIKEALALIERTKVTSPWLQNARGVCQLRLGNSKEAVDIYRAMVLGAGAIVLRTDVPIVFLTNYATALLLAGNLLGGRSVLDDLKTKQHPAIERLQASLAAWKGNLTAWQRFVWALGGEPERPVTLDFPPGDLI